MTFSLLLLVLVLVLPITIVGLIGVGEGGRVTGA
jgi:hypothetical protein